MNIRAKIVLVVFPLIITPLVFTGFIAALSARNGITAVATQFLRFKNEQLLNYASGQWSLLVDNGLEKNESMVAAAKSAVDSFAAGIVRSDSELVLAVTSAGSVELAVGAVSEQTDGQQEETLSAGAIGLQTPPGRLAAGWHSLSVGGSERVAYIERFEPFDWWVLVTEDRGVFYAATNQIVERTAMILAVSLLFALLLLLAFAGYLTRPLRSVVGTMEGIIATNDLSGRVEVLYRDETGRLGHTFNVMIEELQKATDNIKAYATRAAIAQTKEQRIRNIFQKYVPKDVIEEFFRNPEAMLVGEDRPLAVLFADIRAFTSISEQLTPNIVVESLNQYFTLMVDAIMSRGGLVDKYIGDAIMAFFGAPVKHRDDETRSVLAALDMLDVLADFNTWQAHRELPPFRIGIGINYGAVTIGNIGSEKKMDYTVIGDMVNLASRLEGLTKTYGQPLLISESVRRKLDSSLRLRLMDHVKVKGRKSGVGVYAVGRGISDQTVEAWELHNEAMTLFYDREFAAAKASFQRVAAALGDDKPSALMIDRCKQLLDAPPVAEWTGEIEMTVK